MAAQNVSVQRKITVTAIMSALGAALMFIEVPIPVMPSFIKLDLSELPAIITSFAFGPLCGVLVCLLKNAIHLLSTHSMGIGELSNFLLGSVFVLTAGLIYERKKSRKSALAGSLTGSVLMAAAAFAVNLFLIYPLYMKFMIPEEAILGMYQSILPSVTTLSRAILIFNVPFTLVKGLLNVVITFLIYHKLSPVLKGNR